MTPLIVAALTVWIFYDAGIEFHYRRFHFEKTKWSMSISIRIE